MCGAKTTSTLTGTFVYQLPSDNFFQQPVVSWQEASGLNPTTELQKRVPTSMPQFPQHNEIFSEDITSAALNDVSVSSTLPSHELQLRPPVCLPSMSSCQLPAFTQNIFLRSLFYCFVSLRAWAQYHLHNQDLCDPLKCPLFTHMAPKCSLIIIVPQICRRLLNRDALKLSFSLGIQPK